MPEINEIAKNFVKNDCLDLLNTIYCVSESDKPIFLMASIPYVCLVVNEAYMWCIKANVTMKAFQSKTLLENIRAKAKLFSNDNIISFKDQCSLIDRLIKTEHLYYKSLAKPYCPDCLIDDVGSYLLNGIYIGNTIQYAFDFYGFSKTDVSIYESGNEIKSFSSEIGSKIQEIIVELSGQPYIIRNIFDTQTSFTNKDYKYKSKFHKIENIIVFSLVCRINFLLYSFKEKCPQNSMLYLRLIYITFFSMKSDIENLGITCSDVFDSYFNNMFRNCMAHYSLYKKIDISEIYTSVIGYGLIEKYFSIDYYELVKIIENKLLMIRSSLEMFFKC